MNARRHGYAMALLVAAGIGWANAAADSAAAPVAPHPSGLPTEAEVTAALRQSPRIGAAVESVDEGRALERSLRAGLHEWEISTLTQRRRDLTGMDHTETEFGIGVGVRWPWKRLVDQRIGEAARQTGELAYLDAWHEAARHLLDLWFAWVATEQGAQLLLAQVDVLDQQHATVARRVAAGDAPRVEARLAEADLQRQRAALDMARRDALLARQALGAEFPTLRLSMPEASAPPQVLPGEDEGWISQIVEHNHEIELAESRALQASLSARRATQDRLADPVLGLRYTDNLGGERRVVGLQFTLPIGGAARAASADLARSSARRSANEARYARDTVVATATSSVADARLSYAGWQQQAAAQAGFAEAARVTERGYALGEFDIAALLTSRRDAIAAEHELLAARLQAQRAYARVLIDAHRIWAAPDHETHER